MGKLASAAATAEPRFRALDLLGDDTWLICGSRATNPLETRAGRGAPVTSSRRDRVPSRMRRKPSKSVVRNQGTLKAQ